MEFHDKRYSAEHLSQINKFINGIFSDYEGVKTNAAKIILYRLVELSLASQNEKCRTDCKGTSIMFDTNKVRITMPTENILFPTEQIKEALIDLHSEFLDINDEHSYYVYRLFESVSISKKEPYFLGLDIDGAIWEGIYNYSSCVGMEYLISHKDTLYSIDLDPKQEEQYLFVKSILYQILDGANSDLYELAAKKVVCADKLENMFIKLKFYEIEVKEEKMSLEEKENAIINDLRNDFQIHFTPSSNKNKNTRNKKAK